MHRHVVISTKLMALLGLALTRYAAPALGDELLPEPIPWRQHVFSIPYRVQQMNTPQDRLAEVQLFCSSDGGTSWQLVGRAKAEVQSFTFRAPHDGDYLFSMRSIDSLGRALPNGPHRAKLRVAVDTVEPRLDLECTQGPAGEIKIGWRAVDPNLRPTSLIIETRTGPDDVWQPLAIGTPLATVRSTVTGQATWWPKRDAASVNVRAEIMDQAGNRSVVQDQVVRQQLPLSQPDSRMRAVSGNSNVGTGSLTSDRTSVPSDLIALPSTTATDRTIAEPEPEVDDQFHPAMRSHDASSGSDSSANSFVWPADQITTEPMDRVHRSSLPQVDAQTLNQIYPQGVPPEANVVQAPALEQPPIPAPNRTSRNAQRGPVGGKENAQPIVDFGPQPRGRASPAPANTSAITLPPGVQPNMVNAHSFDLEYDVESIGPWGISVVELWGTRDNGQTWTSYGVDGDNLSPMRVRVGQEGLFGFHISVQSASGTGGDPPSRGSLPQVWVGVDLTGPEARLVSVEQGQGNLVDHLVIRWEATDDRLGKRPIALMFRNQPSERWSTIASGLENTGYYAWRVSKRASDPLHLRLVVRDAAGNTTVRDTQRPVSLVRPRPSGRIRAVRPVGKK